MNIVTNKKSVWPIVWLILSWPPVDDISSIGLQSNTGNLAREKCLHFARVSEIYDGDTVTLDVHLWLDSWLVGIKVRLARIQAPEITGREKPQGLESKVFLQEFIKDRQIYVSAGQKFKDKYGRYLFEMFVAGDTGMVNVSDVMLKSGKARVYGN